MYACRMYVCVYVCMIKRVWHEPTSRVPFLVTLCFGHKVEQAGLVRSAKVEWSQSQVERQEYEYLEGSFAVKRFSLVYTGETIGSTVKDRNG